MSDSHGLSFIVPAHNEQSTLGKTLDAINAVAERLDRPYDIIVVDDASTDATSTIAAERNAHVVHVNHRQIAATRNSGGRAARGDILFFVDADTTINERVVRSALRALSRGAAGGGAQVRFEDSVPLYARLLLWWLNWIMWLVGMCGGAFMFCTRDAFEKSGGFDENLFGGEDAAMCWALKREGAFVVLWPHVLTSGRRVQGTQGMRMCSGLIRMAFFPGMLRRRADVQRIWYESNRTEALETPLWLWVFNALALAFVVLMISGPLWLIPWPEGPMPRPFRAVQVTAGIIGLHVGLLLFPCIYFLTCILLHQRRWPERLKLFALIAGCVWLAWGNLFELMGFWRGVYDWFRYQS